MRRRQGEQGIEKQEYAEHAGQQKRIVTGQNGGAHPRAKDRGDQKRGQPPGNLEEPAADQTLPGVGDDRRNDDQGDAVLDAQPEGQYWQRKCGQAGADHTLDGSGEQKGETDEQQ